MRIPILPTRLFGCTKYYAVGNISWQYSGQQSTNQTTICCLNLHHLCFICRSLSSLETMRPVGNKETAPTRVSDLARGPDGAAYAISDQHPAESFLYGLRGDMEWVIINKDVLVTPEERGFTSTAGDNGLCKYCQLILSPSPPPATIHQKNLQALILSASTCNLCQAINSSLAEGSPTVGYLYNRGFLPFCDPNDTSHPISVSISAHSTHTQFFPVVGQRQVDPMAGRPLIASTASRLGGIIPTPCTGGCR